MNDLSEQLQQLIDESAAPVTVTELAALIDARSAADPAVPRSIEGGRTRGLTHKRGVQAGFAVALCVVIIGAFVLVSPPAKVRTAGAPKSKLPTAAPHWRLTAALSGPQFVLATGNPEAVVGVVCSHLPTCLLSTGYGSGGAAANIGSTYVSSDGGHSWVPSTLPTNVTTTTLASCVSTNWCAAGGGLLDYATGDPAAKKPSRDPVLLISTDAGHTWTTKTVPIPVNVEQLPAYGDLPAETTYWPGVIDAVSCSSPGVCNVVGSTGVNSPSGGGADEVVFLSTSDGGDHWKTTVLPERTSERSLQLIEFGGASVSMSCATKDNCVTVASFYSLIPNGGDVDAWVTSDGGRSWAEHQIQGITQMTTSISCPDVKVCWAGPASGGAARSTDGGVTWSLVPLPAPSSATISCVSATTCYVGGNGIEETADGGTSWQPVTLPPQVGSVAAVSCEPMASCAAIANPVIVGPDFIQGGSVVLTNAPEASA